MVVRSQLQGSRVGFRPVKHDHMWGAGQSCRPVDHSLSPKDLLLRSPMRSCKIVTTPLCLSGLDGLQAQVEHCE